MAVVVAVVVGMVVAVVVVSLATAGGLSQRRGCDRVFRAGSGKCGFSGDVKLP